MVAEGTREQTAARAALGLPGLSRTPSNSGGTAVSALLHHLEPSVLPAHSEATVGGSVCSIVGCCLASPGLCTTARELLLPRNTWAGQVLRGHFKEITGYGWRTPPFIGHLCPQGLQAPRHWARGRWPGALSVTDPRAGPEPGASFSPLERTLCRAHFMVTHQPRHRQLKGP